MVSKKEIEKLHNLEITDEVDLKEYIKVRDEVKSSMEYPDWLGDFTKEDLEELLNKGSKIWAYYFEGEMVASGMTIPASEKSLAKFNLDFDYHEVIDYGPMFVNKKYLGYGMQYKTLLDLDKYAVNAGYRYAVSTVHPDNVYSIKNFLKDDFVEVNTVNLKRGPRKVFVKRLEK